MQNTIALGVPVYFKIHTMLRIPVYNAACPRSKEPADLEALLATRIPVITVGSISLEKQGGNRAKAYRSDPETGLSLNSFGLPNRGLAYYEKYLPAFIEKARIRRKKVRASIVARHPREFAALVRRLRHLGVDQIEVNVSCPNVWDGKIQKGIIAFSPALLCRVVVSAGRAARGFPLDYKVPPYSDPGLLARVATIFNAAPGVRAVVTANTFPNAWSRKTGLAGLGGSPFRAIVLGQVVQFRKLLRPGIRVVAIGGVSSPEHVREYRAAGAAEVQVGTQYFEQGARVFARLNRY